MKKFKFFKLKSKEMDIIYDLYKNFKLIHHDLLY